MVDSVAMPTPREVIVANPAKNGVLVWELWGKHKMRVVPHLFMSEDIDQSQVDCFSETGYVCVREWGRYNEHRLHMTYYKQPFTP